MRILAVGLLCVVTLACSSTDEGLDVPPVPTAAPAGETPASGDAAGETPVGPAGDSATGADEVRLTIGTPSGSAAFDHVVEPGADLDPFGRFASCSGWREVVGTYGVTVTEPGEPIEAVALLTVAPIEGPGTYDADVRVELSDGGSVLATGTVTLGDDLRTGRFLAFDPDGGRHTGEFACPSPRPSPRPAEGERVEVVALIRRDGSERVLGLTVDGGGATCRGVTGAADSPVVVRVDGDERVGAITTFELTDAGSPTMRLRVGGTSYEFEDVDVELDDESASGAFRATGADGLAVDGAFRCR